MKKYFALVLTLVMLLSLGACGEKEYVDDPHALETADTFYSVEDNAVSLNLTEDSVKVMLGVFTPEQLRLKATIDEYDLTLSATEFEGKTACKAEAFAEGNEKAEGTFMIVGSQCLVYDAKTKKYVPIISVNTTTDKEKSTSPADTIPDDPDITFQYHKENNYLMQQKFSAYDNKTLGLSKAVTEYVFIINGNSGIADDGERVYYVDVYEKNGESIGVRLGFNESGEYAYNAEGTKYTRLEK